MTAQDEARSSGAAQENKLYSQGDYLRLVEQDAENPSYEEFRSPFRRDFARLIHSPSFRRLQGKTQVFPGHESDYFRNRLTHSLEVAQIAKSIAIRLNSTNSFFRENPIDVDVVEFAGLAHDLGHPPFGHNGEEALDELMKDDGGFEGNAQTLRILSRLEKKKLKFLVEGMYRPIDKEYGDLRAGLDLTFRSLASILKYASPIPSRQADRGIGIFKGYYAEDEDLVQKIKSNVAPGGEAPFKTIECSIMDIADDIAYSTYDLEDNFKAGFLSPASVFSLSPEVIVKVKDTINERAKKYYSSQHSQPVTIEEVHAILFIVFKFLFALDDKSSEFWDNIGISAESKIMYFSAQTKRISDRIKLDGYERTDFSSRLVQRSLEKVKVEVNESYPQLSAVQIEYEHFKVVEVLKNITFYSIIMSSKMQIVEYRGKDIIRSIYSAITSEKGRLLLPDDYRELYEASVGSQKKRVVVDFIAGMTDRYAIEFYNRICGSAAVTIFKPH